MVLSNLISFFENLNVLSHVHMIIIYSFSECWNQNYTLFVCYGASESSLFNFKCIQASKTFLLMLCFRSEKLSSCEGPEVGRRANQR